MKHALLAAGLVAGASIVGIAGLVTPLAAQTAAPETAPVPDTKSDAKSDAEERRRNGAAKLAGMIRFVAADCPEAEPDFERFKSVVAAMGVDIKDLEDGPLMGRSLSYSQAYHKEQAASCKKAFELFGETGTAIPRLIARKAPKAGDAPGEGTAPAVKEAPKDAPKSDGPGATPKP